MTLKQILEKGKNTRVQYCCFVKKIVEHVCGKYVMFRDRCSSVVLAGWVVGWEDWAREVARVDGSVVVMEVVVAKEVVVAAVGIGSFWEAMAMVVVQATAATLAAETVVAGRGGGQGCLGGLGDGGGWKFWDNENARDGRADWVDRATLATGNDGTLRLLKLRGLWDLGDGENGESVAIVGTMEVWERWER